MNKLNIIVVFTILTILTMNLGHSNQEVIGETDEVSSTYTVTTNLPKFYLGIDKNHIGGYNGIWEIKKNSRSVCKLKLSFEDFLIKESVDCVTDFLQVAVGSQVYNFCGKKINENVIIPWREDLDTLTIILITDSVANVAKLRVMVAQELGTCSNYISYRQFYVESQGFAQNLPYPGNSVQEWFVVKNSSEICQLELEVIEFELQTELLDGVNSNLCIHDTLAYNEAGNMIFKCGIYKAGTKWLINWPNNESSNTIPFQFVTDLSKEARGFRLLISQIPCNI